MHCPIRVIIAVFLTCLLVVGAAGCVDTATMNRGDLVTKVAIAPLVADGPYSDRVQTFEFAIDYAYTRDNGFLDISGTVTPGAYYLMNAVIFMELHVYLYFVDQDTRVLETVQLVKTAGLDVRDRVTFSQRCPVPEGATGISFGYEGSVKEIHEVSSFYNLPARK